MPAPARPRDAVSRSAVRRETTHLGIRLRRILRCAAGGASWTRPFGIPSFLRAFEGRKGVGLSLYRLSSSCHTDSLIPAVRFFRKEKSSLLPAKMFPAPHRACGGIPSVAQRCSLQKVCAQQNTLGTFCVAVAAPPMGMNFFFTKKWVGGRSSLQKVSARQVPHPKKFTGSKGI